MNLLITGGAGFIGSHLIDRLLSNGHSVVCIDDLSLGRKSNISHNLESDRFDFVEMNILDKPALEKLFQEHSFDCVFHMAANSDIQMGARYMNVDLEKTFLTTYMLLDVMHQHDVRQIVFASSSAVYGELDLALKEDSGPLFPVSFYGAAKLASEGYISAACTNYKMQAWLIRFPNVVGERATHGVIYDFIGKLEKNPNELEILGNGTQEKPYLYVKDLVDAIEFIWTHAKDQLNFFNVAVDSRTSVTEIAEIVADEMNLGEAEFKYTGGDRGWVGDVPKFRYDTSKVERLGWKAPRSSNDSVRMAVREELEIRRSR